MIGLWYNQAMLNRQKKCLREIIASYFGATCEELCELGGIGEKTLRNDIGILQDALQKYGLFLREEKNRLWIPFEEKEAFLNAYEEIIQEDDQQLLASEHEERKIRREAGLFCQKRALAGIKKRQGAQNHTGRIM